MPDEKPVPQQLRQAALQAVKMLVDHGIVGLHFDVDGVRWADGYINRNRASFPAGQRRGLVAYLAAFVGECIIQSYGGEWTLGDHGLWGIQVSPQLWACPSAKIDKQFENGPSDSVASFVEAIPALVKRLAAGDI